MIRNIGTLRVLQVANSTWQSVINVNTPDKPVFDYAKAFIVVSKLVPQQNNILIVGGGAYTLPGILENTYPKAKIDVVEIDQSLLPISEKYFDFTPTPKIRVISEDGRQYLNNNKRRYNLIYLDAFSNSTPPFQLMTWQADQRIYSALESNGIVAVNLYSTLNSEGAHYISSVSRTFSHVFDYVATFQVNNTTDKSKAQNILLLASQRALTPAITSLAESNSFFKSIVNTKFNNNRPTGMLLSDDFAPVEQMIAKQE